MFNHRFTGYILVNGSPLQINIHGKPLGRTVVEVDGHTVYDRKPFLQKDIVDFELLPGKAAQMRWHQVSPLKMECDVIVDSRATTLSPLTKDGSIRKPVGAEGRKDFQIRAGSFGVLVAAAFFLWLNHYELSTNGEYYPKLLAIVPVPSLMGVMFLLHPRLDFSPTNKRMVWVTIGITTAALLFGATIFTNWFLRSQGAH